MSLKPANLAVLETLRQLRERVVEEVTGRLSQQKLLCQRYHSNISALSALSDGDSTSASDAAHLHNQARFKANIQRVIDWQKQQQALATIEQTALQSELTQQACREQALRQVILQQKGALDRVRQRQEQKNTDALAMQSWLRERRSRNSSL